MIRTKIAKNTLILLLSRFGSRLLIFGFGIYVARSLGAATFGKIVFASSFVLTFTPLADFGIENYLLREVSRRLGKRIKILQSFFYPRVFLAVAAYFLAIALTYLFGYGREDVLNISLYGLMLLPYSLNYFFLAYFNAQEKFVKASLLKIFYPVVHVGLGLIFLFLHLPYRWLLLAVVIGNSVSALAMLFFYPQLVLKFKFSWIRLKKVVKRTWFFALLIFIAVFYLRLDVMILKKIIGNEATGLYGPVSSLIQTGLLLPQSFALALFPISSRLVLSSKQRMKQVYLKGLVVLLLVALPVALSGYCLSPWLVNQFLGGEYLPSIPALKLAFLSLILFFVNALPGNVILNSRKVIGFIPWALANLGVNAALNLILIPQLSFVGAAWAKIGSEFFGLVINNLYVYRILHEKT